MDYIKRYMKAITRKRLITTRVYRQKETIDPEEFKAFAITLKLISLSEWFAYLKHIKTKRYSFTNKFGMKLPISLPFDIDMKYFTFQSVCNSETTEEVFQFKKNLEEFIGMHNYGTLDETVAFYKSLNFTDYHQFVEYIAVCSRAKRRRMTDSTVLLMGVSYPMVPASVPLQPHHVHYKEIKARNLGGFIKILGYRHQSYDDKNLLPYDEAKEYIQQLGMRSHTEYKVFLAKIRHSIMYNFDGAIVPPRPTCIPSNPERYYKLKGTWISWEDFLGEDYSQTRIALDSGIYDFETCRDLIRSYNFSNLAEFRYFIDMSEIYGFYRNTLGEMIPARSTKIPLNPRQAYSHDWISWYDFLYDPEKCLVKNKRTNDRAYLIYKEHVSYQDAKAFACKLRLTSQTEWHKYIEMTEEYGFYVNRFNEILGPKPSNIPKDVWFVYKKHGWVSWADFLYDSNYAVHTNTFFPKFKDPNRYWSYEKAREFIRSLKFSTSRDMRAYLKSARTLPYYNAEGRLCPRRPDELPDNPMTHYQEINQWVTWADFSGIVEKGWLYDDLAEYARKYQLKNEDRWREFANKHKHFKLPVNVEKYCRVRNMWTNWITFANINLISYASADEARKFISSKKFKKYKDYLEWWDKEQPVFLPRSLNYYRQFGYTPMQLIGRDITEKLENLAVDCSVFYISRYDNDPPNVINISIDHESKLSACQKMKKKRQYLIALFELDDETYLRHLVSEHCDVLRDGEFNRYTTYNLSQFLFMLRQYYKEDKLLIDKVIHNDGDVLIKHLNYNKLLDEHDDFE